MGISPVLFCAALASAQQAPQVSITDGDLRQAIAGMDASNLENAAEKASADLARTVRWIRSLIASSEAALESGRVELETLLSDPEELRRRLSADSGDPVERLSASEDALQLSLQMVSAKLARFLAAIAPPGPKREDRVRLLSLRDSYPEQDRAGDLLKVRQEAEEARKRFPQAERATEAQPALQSLEDMLAELRSALAQLRPTAEQLGGIKGRRKPHSFLAAQELLDARSKTLERDIADLRRESELLRHYMILDGAHKIITAYPNATSIGR